jgi:pimeloyl-ACP methyl ester carboxylesterase
VDLPFTGFKDDAAVARNAIAAAGPESVVVGHSYGGLVISEAASGFVDLRRLVYLAAFLTDIGEDQSTILSRHGSPLLGAVELVDGAVVVRPDQARSLFFGDSDARSALQAVDRLRPMGLDGDGMGPVSVPAWKTTPTTYVVCTHDGALPPSAQREMATRATTVIEWPTDHSPFLTRPDEVAALCASYVHHTT